MKRIASSYTFDASEKTVVIPEPSLSTIDQILCIINVTDGEIIYLPVTAEKTGTWDDGTQTLTLTYDTTSMSDTDALQVIFDDLHGSSDLVYDYDSSTVYHSDFIIPRAGYFADVDIHPKVVSESCIYSSDEVQELEAGQSVVGTVQVFRASTDNIHDVKLFLTGDYSSGSITAAEGFEYATTTLLRNVWSSSNLTYLTHTVESTIVQEGSYSMKVAVDVTTAIGNSISRDFGTPLDWSDSNAVGFYLRSEVSGPANLLRLEITDSSANTCYADVYPLSADVWEEFEFVFSAMNNHALVDFSSVQSIAFRVQSWTLDSNFYVDDLHSEGEVGLDKVTAEVQLIDFGATSNPTVMGTVLNGDEGNSSVVDSIDVADNVKLFHVHRGSHDLANVLTVGNYYGIYLKAPADGRSKVRGKSSGQLYQSGKFYTVDSSDNLTEVSGASSAFVIMASAEGVIKEINVELDDEAPDSYMWIMLADLDKKLEKLIAVTEFSASDLSRKHTFSSELAEQVQLQSSNQLIGYFLNGIDSQTRNVSIEVKIHYNGIEAYG